MESKCPVLQLFVYKKKVSPRRNAYDKALKNLLPPTVILAELTVLLLAFHLYIPLEENLSICPIKCSSAPRAFKQESLFIGVVCGCRDCSSCCHWGSGNASCLKSSRLEAGPKDLNSAHGMHSQSGPRKHL